MAGDPFKIVKPIILHTAIETEGIKGLVERVKKEIKSRNSMGKNDRVSISVSHLRTFRKGVQLKFCIV